MRRRKNNLRTERIIMISASAFVLTALTMAGVYVREQSKVNDEYRVDLSELNGQSLADKTSEIADNRNMYENNLTMADDLDADPDFWEAGSTGVDAVLSNGEKVTADDDNASVAQNHEDTQEVVTAEQEEALAENESGEEVVEAGAENVVAANYNFPTQMELSWPLYGNLIMNYSMDKTIFFETLGQYRYNPALIIDAEVGSQVYASANGIVKEIYTSTELGTAVVMDIGEGYELTYGQLENVVVNQGDIVNLGTPIGTVANPSVYYSNEGSNLYFKMTKDGVAVNPMDVLP